MERLLASAAGTASPGNANKHGTSAESGVVDAKVHTTPTSGEQRVRVPVTSYLSRAPSAKRRYRRGTLSKDVITMATKRPNWFMRLMVMFYGPAEHSPVNEPRTSPEAQPSNCPLCKKPLDEHVVERSEGKSRTRCPAD